MNLESRVELPILGVLPEKWKVVPLGNLLDGGTRNGIYKSKEFHGRGAKIVNMGELFGNNRLGDIPMKRVEVTSEELLKSSLKSGDLLFARRSLTAEGAGKCSIVRSVTEPTVFESSIIRARPDTQKVIPEFLYYVFQSPYGSYILDTIKRTVAVSGITGADLVTLPIPTPPVTQQQVIASALTKIDDKIELNNHINETLKLTAEGFFKEWFIDFGPVKAKSEGKKPFGMNAEVAALFPDSFQESELGMIPKGWKVGNLRDICTVTGGFAFKSSDFTDSGHPVIKIKNISESMDVDLTDVDFVAPEIASNVLKFHLKEGSLIMAMTGATVGKFGLVLNTANLIPVLNQRVALLEPKDKNIGFLLAVLLATDVYSQVVNRAEGSAQPNISADGIMDTKILIPADTVRERFCEISNNFFDLWKSNQKESATLKKMRDLLLPKLISGEIELDEVMSD